MEETINNLNELMGIRVQVATVSGGPSMAIYLPDRKAPSAEQKLETSPAMMRKKDDLEMGVYAEARNATSTAHGFWNEATGIGEAIALMHSELSEALRRCGTETRRARTSQNTTGRGGAGRPGDPADGPGRRDGIYGGRGDRGEDAVQRMEELKHGKDSDDTGRPARWRRSG